ncbi:hypothetical protein [Corynebacterium epidermidicanis]|uniref:Uncharacterized protein n=1 Tax=Corynebacterium epidermidicanis TaxID=1050174 RepID=A0A0G3GWF5_9CORY|nr:hypothetical protein [Corynebacterium epidermidicanis]AKK03858.1 hypothetical protein CEPID_10095 [Corynebacterium epidermidicanis]
MSSDIDLAADFSEDSPVLPALTEVYGADSVPEDLDFDAMLAVATDPDTPAPEGDLVPELGSYDSDYASDPLTDDLPDLAGPFDLEANPVDDPLHYDHHDAVTADYDDPSDTDGGFDV